MDNLRPCICRPQPAHFVASLIAATLSWRKATSCRVFSSTVSSLAGFIRVLVPLSCQSKPPFFLCSCTISEFLLIHLISSSSTIATSVVTSSMDGCIAEIHVAALSPVVIDKNAIRDASHYKMTKQFPNWTSNLFFLNVFSKGPCTSIV